MRTPARAEGGALSLRVVLVVVAAVAVLLAVRANGGGDGDGRRVASANRGGAGAEGPDRFAATTASAAPTSTSTSTTSTTTAHAHDGAAHDDGEGYPDTPPPAGRALASIGDPAQSDLGPELARAAAAAGAAFVRADVTGEGRDAFAGYWSDGRAQPCCRSFVLHAAAAASTSDPAVVRVRVVWSAQRLDGRSLAEQVTVAHLVRQGGSWRALQPWEAPR